GVMTGMTISIGTEACDLAAWLVARFRQIRSVELVQFKRPGSVSDRTHQGHRSYKLVSLQSDAATAHSPRDLWFPKHEASVVDLISQGKVSEPLLTQIAWHDETGLDVIHNT